MGAPLAGSGPAPEAPLLRVTEVAAHLQISTATVYKLAHSGSLPFVRILGSLRFRHSDLVAFMAARKR